MRRRLVSTGCFSYSSLHGRSANVCPLNHTEKPWGPDNSSRAHLLHRQVHMLQEMQSGGLTQPLTCCGAMERSSEQAGKRTEQGPSLRKVSSEPFLRERQSPHRIRTQHTHYVTSTSVQTPAVQSKHGADEPAEMARATPLMFLRFSFHASISHA